MNFNVVSGLAVGIETEVHKDVIDLNGITNAVLPCSLDRIYPRDNRRLAERIVNLGGLLL